MADNYKKWFVTQMYAQAEQAAALAKNHITFKRMVASQDVIDESDLPGLTNSSIQTINAKQTTLISSQEAKGNSVTIVAVFNNSEVATDYLMNTLLLVAEYNGTEFLAAATVANTAWHMPANSETEKSEITFKAQLAVSNTSVVDMTLDPNAYATNESLNKMRDQLAGIIDENKSLIGKLQQADTQNVKVSGNQNVSGTKTFLSKIIGSLSGNADTASKLLKPFNLNGKSVDGSQDVQVNAANDDQLVHQSGAESIGGTKTFTAGPVVKQEVPGLWFGTTGSPDGNQQLIRLGSTGTMGTNVGYFGTNQLAFFGGGEGAGAIQKDIYTDGKAKGDLSFLDATTESAALVGDGSVYIITHANNYQNGTYSGHSVIEITSGGDIIINGKSYDADLVHKSGNETVGGDKNFTGTMSGTTKINQIVTALSGNSVVSMRPDIQAYEYSAKGLTFRFIKIGATAFVNISGNVSEDITSEEILMSFGSASNAKAYASPYWAGGETTGYKGSAISLGQTGSLSIWDDGSIRISYRGPKVSKGAWLDGSITYISNSPLPGSMIANNS